MLVTLKQILAEAVEKEYAVGAFDTLDDITTEAILTAAEARGLPVIVMVPPVTIKSSSGAVFMDQLLNRCKKSPIPICVHLDHGHTYEDCMLAISYGCTSVMIDASEMSYADNVQLTKRVVEAARAAGVSVEGEIGHVSGHESYSPEGNIADESGFTTTEEALRYCADTGIDAIAVAIGTVHGVYRGTPHLQLDLLREMRANLELPIVIHGGSGLQPQDYSNLVSCGANKINFFTAMSLAGAAAVRELMEGSKPYSFLDIVAVGNEAQKRVVEDHIELFRTQPLMRI